MTDNQVQVSFGADTSGLESGLQKISAQLTEFFGNATKGMEGFKGAGEGLGSLIEGLGGALTGIGAMLAGGAIFAEGIKAAQEEAAEVRNLMNSLGMTAEEASKMKIALELVGISAEEYVGIAMKFDMMLRKNEEGLKKLGVVTRDQNGHLLAQDLLLKNAANTMMEYKAGTDRNAVAMALLGRSAAEAFKLLKLNDGVKERAAELAEKLGEIMTDEELENVKRYKMEMAATGVAIDAFSENLGGAVMPGLTKMAQAFMEIVMSVMPAIKAAFDLLGDTVSALGDIVKSTVDSIVELLNYLAGKTSETVGNSIPGDWLTWENVLKSIRTTILALKEIIVMTIDALVLGTKQLLAFQDAVAGAAADVVMLRDPSAGLKARWKEAMDAGKEWNEKQVAMEKRFSSELEAIWFKRDEAEKRAKGGNKDYTGQDKKDKAGNGKGDKGRMSAWAEEIDQLRYRYMLEHDLREMSKEDELAEWEKIKQRHKLTSQERLEISRRESRLRIEILKDEKRQQEAMAAESIQSERELSLGRVAVDEENAKVAYDLHQSSFDEYQNQLVQFEDRRYEIEKAALERLIELDAQDPRNAVKVQQERSKLLVLEQQHGLKYLQIVNATTREASKKWQELFKSLNDGFSRSLAGFIVGTQNLQQMMSGIYQTLLQSLVDFVAKQIAAGIESLVFHKAVATEEIPRHAAVAASEAAESVAGTPVVGPELAAAAYASTFSMVMGGMAFAAQGYDIPAGVNPITQLHQREMVLPAPYADLIRGMAEKRGQPQPSPSQEVNLHVSAIDGQSVRRFMVQNKAELVRGLREAARNGANLSISKFY